MLAVHAKKREQDQPADKGGPVDAKDGRRIRAIFEDIAMRKRAQKAEAAKAQAGQKASRK